MSSFRNSNVKYPPEVEEAMMDAMYEAQQQEQEEYDKMTKEEQEEYDANKKKAEEMQTCDEYPEKKGALFIKRRHEYDKAIKQSHSKQVILMIGQTWSVWHSVPWYDELATEEDMPSVLVKADLDCSTTEFLKDMYETTCIPSFYIFKNGKLHVTIEHEEVDVIQAWARAGKEPEGWPNAFGYGDDGGALDDGGEFDAENFQGVVHVGIDDSGQQFDHLGKLIPGVRRTGPNPLTQALLAPRLL